jgi:hypothetical protein
MIHSNPKHLGEDIDNEPIHQPRNTVPRIERKNFYEQEINERQINERYRNYSESGTSFQDLPEEALKPTKQDSPLWVLRCKQGKEKDCVLQIMQLHFARMELGKPLEIMSTKFSILPFL